MISIYLLPGAHTVNTTSENELGRMTFASDHNFHKYVNTRRIKELGLKMETNCRMCDNTIVLFVSWSNEQ